MTLRSTKLSPVYLLYSLSVIVWLTSRSAFFESLSGRSNAYRRILTCGIGGGAGRAKIIGHQIPSS